MDFFDALTALEKANPDCNESELRSALDSEVATEEARLKGRDRYRRAVETAYGRIAEWLASGDEYAVSLDYRDMARFVASHRPACVYAVLVAKARAAETVSK